MKIFLVGMPGSGKSTVGKLLADSLDMPFIDLDKVIEQEEGTTIREIFNVKGESYFRDQERNTLHKVVSSNDRFVLATGGGVPCFFDNMDFMKRQGKVIFMDIPVAALAKRLQNEGLAIRPLLKDFSTLDRLEEHLFNTFSKRRTFYIQADFQIEADTPAATLVEKIRESIQ